MQRWISFAVFACGLIGPANAQSSVDASFDPATGEYRVSDGATGWSLGGSIGTSAEVRRSTGRDVLGPFHELRFAWKTDVAQVGTIRVYEKAPAVRFRLEYPDGRAGKSTAFPCFTEFPKGLHGFSHRDTEFSPGTFQLEQTSTPWLLFDDRARSMILSPASEFMIAKMVGDGQSSLGMALNDRLMAVPKGLRQDSLLVFANGIGTAWDRWGEALRAQYGRKPVLRDAITEKYGYWTDNGADYYYNYDLSKGYAGTLLALRDAYRAKGLPLGYLQLDSWWYRKLSDGISGEKNPGTRNPRMPAGDWNRYGGVLEYRAAPDLFPNGLDAFRRDLGLPFIVHGRWIDRDSPLRQRYAVSGVAPIDRRYWDDTAEYLAKAGAISYEQDWLDHIYDRSPEMFSVAGVADRFADGMAEAMRRKGLSMQYCMAPPRFVLQGVKYPNLSTVRTTTDRFVPSKWAQFLFGSPLVTNVGALPWADVFRSRETGNLIMALLSAGPVGTGDAIGAEDAANLRRAARPDALLVRPDRPLMPTDEAYLNEAAKIGHPLVGTTWTDHSGVRTTYVFAFPRKPTERAFRVGLPSGKQYVVDPRSGDGRFAEGSFEGVIGEEGFAYFEAAPVTKTGVALLGDLSKFVPTGKARIAAMDDATDGLRVRVSFAKGEGPVTLVGACDHAPKVAGPVRNVRYDAATKRFSFEVLSDREVTIDGRP